jgi:hypothetical protein
MIQRRWRWKKRLPDQLSSTLTGKDVGDDKRFNFNSELNSARPKSRRDG